jgi:hypothetical protein
VLVIEQTAVSVEFDLFAVCFLKGAAGQST